MVKKFRIGYFALHADNVLLGGRGGDYDMGGQHVVFTIEGPGVRVMAGEYLNLLYIFPRPDP